MLRQRNGCSAVCSSLRLKPQTRDQALPSIAEHMHVMKGSSFGACGSCCLQIWSRHQKGNNSKRQQGFPPISRRLQVGGGPSTPCRDRVKRVQQSAASRSVLLHN